MALEQARKSFLSFLQNFPIDDDVVTACVDINFVGRMEGAEIEFDGVLEFLEILIRDLTAVVLKHNDENVLSHLQTEEVCCKKVVTLLAFAMEAHLNKSAEAALISLVAAHVYLLMCNLHSARMFGIYHSSLFQRAITAYRTAYQIKQLNAHASGASRKRGRGKAKTNTTTMMNSTVFASQATTDGDERGEVSASLLRAISTALLKAMEALYLYLQLDFIGTFTKSFASVIDLVTLLTRFDIGSDTSVSAATSFADFCQKKRFSDRGFALMHEAMQEKHNREDLVLSNFVLPRLIFRTFENNFQRGLLTKVLIDDNEKMMQFVKLWFQELSESDLHYLLRLAQNVCHRCLAERLDYRTKTLETALKIIEMLPAAFRQHFYYFAVNYGYMQPQRCRLIAVDLVRLLLNSDVFDLAEAPVGYELHNIVDYEFGSIFEAIEFEDEDFVDDNPTFKKEERWNNFLFFSGENDFSPRDAFLHFLVRATMDKMSVVRGRALVAVMPFLATLEGYADLTRIAKEFLAESRVNVKRILSEANQQDAVRIATTQTQETERATTPIPSQQQSGVQEEACFLTKVSAAPFVDLVVQRCNDRSAITRKFVVPVIERLLVMESNAAIQKVLLGKLQDFCRDPSVTVRKLGAEAITNIVRDEPLFKHAWLHTVLPMVNDREETVEKTCRRMFFDKIVLPIIANDGSDSLSWNLLIEIAKTSEFMRAFRRCFQQTARDDEYKKVLYKLAQVLYGAVKVDSVASSAWMLLDYLADVIDIDPVPAVHAWFASDDRTAYVDPSVRIIKNPTEVVSVLSVLLKRRSAIARNDRELLRENLAQRILALLLPETVIAEAVVTFIGIVNVNASTTEQEEVQEFLRESILHLYQELLTAPVEESKLSLEERQLKIAKRLLTLGQCALHAPMATTEPMIQLMAHILSVEAPSLDENIAGVLARPGMMPTLSQPNFNPHQISKLQGLHIQHITPNICAAAVLCMGKIMLANDDLAREYLPKMAIIHGSSMNSGVRNNVIYVLADCYLRYTSKMDILQRSFLHGLRDRVDFVRYHTLILTTELLRSQYMKLSPLVIARLLPLLLDPVEAIRDALVGETLAVIEDQHKGVYVENFVTCMFLFNKVGHGTYQDLRKYEMPENPLCFLNHNFSGALKRKQRMQLYTFMLKKFGDQERFLLINQISKTIFGNIVENKISFDTPETKQLVLDAFQVIELPEARLTLEEGERDADEPEEAEIAPEELQKLARATIRAAFCSAFVTHIMPQMMHMARFLSAQRSPLQKEFRNCLAVIAESYPDQLDILFHDSAQLKTEIEAELRRRKRDARKSRWLKNRRLVRGIDNAAHVEQEEPAEEAATAASPNEKQPPIVKTEVVEANDKTVLVSFGDNSLRRDSDPMVFPISSHENADAEPMDVDQLAPAVLSPATSKEASRPSTSESVIKRTPEQRRRSSRVAERNSSLITRNENLAPSTTSKVGSPTESPLPKRRRLPPRLSLGRISALRPANEISLTKSPALAAAVPRLSARVAANVDCDESVYGRFQSTPIKGGGELNFTFSMPLAALSPIARPTKQPVKRHD